MKSEDILNLNYRNTKNFSFLKIILKKITELRIIQHSN